MVALPVFQFWFVLKNQLPRHLLTGLDFYLRAFFFGSAFFCAELFFCVGLFFLGSAFFFGIQLNLRLMNYLLMAAGYSVPALSCFPISMQKYTYNGPGSCILAPAVKVQTELILSALYGIINITFQYKNYRPSILVGFSDFNNKISNT